MATLRIEIKTDNSAFCEAEGEQTPDALAAEVAVILLDLPVKLRAGADGGTLRDSNGNSCGVWSHG